MSKSFEITETALLGLVSIQRKRVGDDRGYFERMFCSQDLEFATADKTLTQINHSQTRRRGTVRGLHFQNPPYAEMKIVSCLKGCVFDVAVDLRKSSPTFLKWHGEVLSAKNSKTILIPEGFAHGFQTLEEDCEMLYFHTAAYHSKAEAGLNALDPKLSVTWPIPITERSHRDNQLQFIGEDFLGVIL